MSRGATARLFAAVDPPAEVAEELARWARAASRAAEGGTSLRVLGPASLHVTLLFLGERPAGEVDPIALALGDAAQGAQPCALETGAPVWLPPRRPRALAVEVHDPSAELASLQGQVARALGAVITPRGAPHPPRRFRAHVTVARSRAAPPPAAALPATPQLRFEVAEVILYRSHLDPEGARYEALARVPLRGWSG